MRKGVSKMITKANNKAVKKPKKKDAEPEIGNEKQCPACGRTVFREIWRCLKCGKAGCDRCSTGKFKTCDCDKVKENAGTKTV